MLDLKKLEEKLDSALANETSQSLTSWLQEKRCRAFLQSLGEGELESIPQIEPNSSFIKSNSITFEVEYSDVSYSQEFLIAA